MVILPSLWEGFPNVILEAMSAKRVVAVSAIGDNPQIIKDGVDGFLFDPNSTGSLATTISKIIELSENKRTAIGASAFEKVVTEYPVEKMIKNTVMVYREFGLC